MKATGVVRRIDELGRIVIPKELRKNLRIKEGENIEIYMGDNENIILKKFSSLRNINDLANYIVDSINQITKLNTIIIDNDSIVAYSGSSKREYQNKYISSFLQDILNNRKNVKNDKKEDIEFVKEKTENAYYIINPIKQNGDVIGALIVFSEKQIDDSIGQIVDTFNIFIDKYLE